MGASYSDVSLIVKYQGESMFFEGLKGSGNIMLDTRIGLYTPDGVPDFSWRRRTTWGEMLHKRRSRLKDPIYGEIVIDFDTKTIKDDQGYGDSFKLNLDWVLMSWTCPREWIISLESIRSHIQAGRVRVLIDRYGDTADKEVRLPTDFDLGVQQLKDYRNSLISRGHTPILFDPPPGWTVSRNF
ncbi:hypothetical protein ACYPKM_04295 [Pseudomonas aeruginosa]